MIRWMIWCSRGDCGPGRLHRSHRRASVITTVEHHRDHDDHDALTYEAYRLCPLDPQTSSFTAAPQRD
jgi:hypothetical protein